VDADPASVRLREKFLVVAATVPSDKALTSRDWNDMDQGQIQNQKLALQEAVLPERILTMTAAWDEDEEMIVKAMLLSGVEADILVLHPAATLCQVRQSLEVRLGSEYAYKLVTASGEILHAAADDKCFAHLMQLGIAESFVDHDAALPTIISSAMDTPPPRIAPSLTSDHANRAAAAAAAAAALVLWVLFSHWY